MLRRFLRAVRRTSGRRIHTMPEEVRDLRRPWASLAEEVRGLTPSLEREFRFGQSVIEIDGSYRLGGNVKGGSSAMWVPSDEATYRTYLAWRSRDGLPRKRWPRAYDRLRHLLAGHGVELLDGSHGDEDRARSSPKRGPLYDLTYRVLRSLPPPHLANPFLRAVQLGGWGPDGAKASAYDAGMVLLYDFAVNGARRTYVGLLLHEMGHACSASLQTLYRSRLEKLYRQVAHPSTLIGVEFLLDGHTRKIYQQRVFEEFLAETYMVYASHGPFLLEKASAFPRLARSAWRDIYQTYREIFHGWEYAA